MRARNLSLIILGFVVGAAVIAFAGSAPQNSASAASEAGSGAAISSDGHDHGAAVAGLTGDTPCERSGPPASDGQTEDAEGGHGHRGPNAQVELTADDRVQLEQQQTQARQVVAEFPTVAAAVAGGYSQSTTYLPCIGAHYTNARYAIAFDPAHPSELLFDGTAPDSKLVGLSYLVFSPSGPPTGFAGENDYWHTHSSNGGLCIKGIVIGAESMSKAECESLGGHKVGLKGVYMVHDWVAPGWECSWGVFAGECPELGGQVGANSSA
jgi:hypothetical protein